MTNPLLLLPRKYLSWSQMSLWRSNKERFRKEYFEGARKLNTKYLTFGKGIASALEDGTYKDLLPNLEVRGTPEYEIRTDVAGVPILSFVDAFDKTTFEFDEYKTGKIPWTQTKVQKHEQLTFYATGLKWKLGKMPKKCRLIWLPTHEQSTDTSDFWSRVDKELSLTGEVVPFERVFDEREIARMELLIVNTAEEISDAYRSFIAEI